MKMKWEMFAIVAAGTFIASIAAPPFAGAGHCGRYDAVCKARELKAAAERKARQLKEAAQRAGRAVRGGFQAVTGAFVGPATGCGRRDYGNRAKSGRRKFDNFQTVSSYRDVNLYLMMQASNKTYYRDFRHGKRGGRYRPPITEKKFRCSATELYKHWGFSRVYFVNSAASANAVVASNRRMVLIAFRGTQDPGKGASRYKVKGLGGIVIEGAKGVIDIGATVMNPPVPFFLPGIRRVRYGQLHAGYAAVTASVVPLIKQALKKIGAGRKKSTSLATASAGPRRRSSRLP
ncbi:MAG: hypothetical protein VCE91_13015 [Nitrospinota bacterium]